MRLFTGFGSVCACLLAITAQADIQQRLDALESGASYTLPVGTLGPLTINVSGVNVRCADDTVIDGGKAGTTVAIHAPDVTLSNCRIRDWGHNLNDMDAGIFVAREARGVELRDNDLKGPAFGIWLDAAPDAKVLGNRIEGEPDLRSQDRGNGIHLFNTQGALIEDNAVSHTRDAIYIETSNNNRIRNNVMSDLRYGIHYMYSHDNLIEGNLTRNTRTGYALMQSKRLTVTGNRSVNDGNYGILMNFITQSTISGNHVSGVTTGETAGVAVLGGEGKAVFIYNSLYNEFNGNVFQDSDIGIHLTAGSEENEVFGNAFINNKRQVKYVSTRTQEWSTEGLGNFWSDYLGWDRDQDGIGDIPYEPNDNIDRLLWTYPEARILMFSPAVDTLRWVQEAFPVVKAAGVTDDFPLMRPPRALVIQAQPER
ncbi:nitrous oxide reductase family maturation protein NosD [Marinobacter salicampi]|uniref:nitrous oxide reductase family maturation protein NosD n=1 Tax=Marinobacter salicampi TaxID=435907 RepID=UPI0014099CE9|nr:nitrous oxide reductase family maturation protein NosD [Marinobacter salicampi]